MIRIVISEASLFDGEYELDNEQPYNGHELHLIKQLSGLRLGEIQEAASVEDYDLMIALAVIALWRAGKADRRTALAVADVLLSAPGGSIVLQVHGDASPPDVTPQGSEDGSNESLTSSSETSNGSGEISPETIPVATGDPS